MDDVDWPHGHECLFSGQCHSVLQRSRGLDWSPSPLTLSLPALFHRQVSHVPIWCPTMKTLTLHALLVFASLMFVIAALVGSIDSIGLDWEHLQDFSLAPVRHINNAHREKKIKMQKKHVVTCSEG
jgi:uncharacterized metal-binding protein